MKPSILTAARICGLAIFLGAANAQSAAPANVAIAMRNLQFDPPAIAVNVGDSVEWTNDDLIPHTVTAKSFGSGTLASGQSWRRTFPEAGNFPYICAFHPQMKGVVTVK